MLLARRKFVQSSLLFAASAFLFSESAGSVLAQTLSNDGQLSTEVLQTAGPSRISERCDWR
jgi:hypothetical protein